MTKMTVLLGFTLLFVGSIKADVVPLWVPDRFFLTTDETTDGNRYMLQEMYWANNNFLPSETYELDVEFDATNGTWLNGEVGLWPLCMPTVLYAATTAPAEAAPYLDTLLAGDLFSCEGSVSMVYTIGYARAGMLPTGTWVSNYFKTVPGSVDRDAFVFSYQKGARTPDWCTSTWCSFGFEWFTAPNTAGIVPNHSQWWNTPQ